MSHEEQNERDKALRDGLLRVVQEHAKAGDDKVLDCIKIKWTQAGYDLALSGYVLEYKNKPTRR
jgi:hypothetical protein